MAVQQPDWRALHATSMPLTQNETRKRNIMIGVVIAVVVLLAVLAAVLAIHLQHNGRISSSHKTSVALQRGSDSSKPRSLAAAAEPRIAPRPDVVAAVKRAFATRPPKDFPIDAVATWVDGADSAWRQRVADAYKTEKQTFPSVMHAAAREPTALPPNGHDELYFNVHLAAANLPWLRNYFVVTERPQKPKWWPASGKVGTVSLVLVHHDDIVGPPLLTQPMYNSAGIQTWLHYIPGLAEHFVLFDDDCFVGRPMKRTDFFKASGKPVTNMHVMNVAAIPTEPRQQTLWNRICLNSRRMAMAAAGNRKPMVVPPHVCVPVVKSLYGAMLTQWFPQETAAFKRFRAPETDFTPQYVHLAILSMMGYVKQHRMAVDTWFHFGGQFAPALTAAKGKLPHLFCINDSLSAAERKLLDAAVDSLYTK